MQLFGHEQESTTSDDYLTPAWVFEDMGATFDLDVAASAYGDHVPAAKRYTLADNGLASPWTGRVWMNPPYSHPNPWARRFIEHGNGIALVPFAKAKWAIELWQAADVVGMPHHWFDFAGGSIFIAVWFAGIGEWTREPISKVAHIK